MSADAFKFKEAAGVRENVEVPVAFFPREAQLDAPHPLVSN